MKQNIVEDKSLDFAVRIVNLSTFLQTNKNDFILSKQILRCGTSIGANIQEALFAQSNSDFISKLSIALKEAGETSYWLKLLFRTGLIDQLQFDSMFHDSDELKSLLSSIIKSSKLKEQRLRCAP